jgi:hypothetical protein
MTPQADLSAEHASELRGLLERLPPGAEWIENYEAPVAHQRCRFLARKQPADLFLKGPPRQEGHTSAELRAIGLVGIYRLPRI